MKSLASPVIVLTAILLGSISTQDASAASFSTFDSDNFGELITSSPADDVYRVVYSVDVGTLTSGDILVVKGDPELSNHTSNNALLSAKLVLEDSSTGVTGLELDEGNAFQVVPGDHGVPYKHAIYRAGSTSKHFVNFAVASNQVLAVEQDYGRLQVLKIHLGSSSYEVFDSGNNGELLTSSPGDDTYRALYSVDLGSISTNDIILADAEGELTNDTGSANVLFSTLLILTDSSTGTSGTQIAEGNAFNITPAMGHGVAVKHAIYQVTSSASAHHFLNCLVRTTSTIPVEQDYGRLQVLVIHP